MIKPMKSLNDKIYGEKPVAEKPTKAAAKKPVKVEVKKKLGKKK